MTKFSQQLIFIIGGAIIMAGLGIGDGLAFDERFGYNFVITLVVFTVLNLNEYLLK